jgi:hypothetical protein
MNTREARPLSRRAFKLPCSNFSGVNGKTKEKTFPQGAASTRSEKDYESQRYRQAFAEEKEGKIVRTFR